ncbi:hypothetical protein GCM10011505_29040 [Tistrella bauzanensis]|uniref:Cytochrome c oxidase assembly protein CtaG n=1 Tax=Tistrella bauzanensis TaxID=657419 RepID=A0ABQ1ILG1_9PROT|nr:cytochrome c oxidase assembly protein [Tistrella bauzanensis]GGB46077.1 hypothetical protein GCM10011505_29040 [Tistrella bauzanensis]
MTDRDPEMGKKATASDGDRRLRRAKRRTLAGVFVMLGGMSVLTAYSSTIYNLFCQVTGYGGTTQISGGGDVPVLDREMTVRFNADTARGMPWGFFPEQREVVVKVGERRLAFYKAVNNSDRPVLGQAAYNVTPQKMGLYFDKIDCFCFTEQLLMPGQSVDMPVSFYIDPKMADDRNVEEVRTVTLSYTFFDLGEDGLQSYLERTGQTLDKLAAAAGTVSADTARSRESGRPAGG